MSPHAGRRRRWPLFVALACVNVPLLVAAVNAGTFYATNRSTGSFVSSGVRRSYVLHVPPGHNATRAAPLIVSLHGAGLWGAAQEDNSQWDRVADREGLIVVYPSAGDGRGAGPKVWNTEPGEGLDREARFIAALIDTIRARYNVDTDRIYVNGLSNGGGMTFALSCVMPRRIAAVGVVAPAVLLPWKCADSTPIPVIDMHGTRDPEIPYGGGDSWIAPRPWPDARQWVQRWARRNGCGAATPDSAIAADVRVRRFAGCARHADVVQYTIVGGGHTWPGGGPLPEWFVGRTTRSMDGASVMWDFFREHPLHAR